MINLALDHYTESPIPIWEGTPFVADLARERSPRFGEPHFIVPGRFAPGKGESPSASARPDEIPWRRVGPGFVSLTFHAGAHLFGNSVNFSNPANPTVVNEALMLGAADLLELDLLQVLHKPTAGEASFSGLDNSWGVRCAFGLEEWRLGVWLPAVGHLSRCSNLSGPVTRWALQYAPPSFLSKPPEFPAHQLSLNNYYNGLWRMPTHLWAKYGDERIHPFVDTDRIQGYLPMEGQLPVVQEAPRLTEGDRLLRFFGRSAHEHHAPEILAVREAFYDRY